MPVGNKKFMFHRVSYLGFYRVVVLTELLCVCYGYCCAGSA